MKTLIMAGGSGTRLWPLSRGKYPKQFITFKGMERSIFQETYRRCLKLASPDDIYIVTNEDYQHIITSQLIDLKITPNDENILLEPQAKNTLPAIYYGMQAIGEKGRAAVAVFPSDHIIPHPDGFLREIQDAEKLSHTHLITFGIRPLYPNTGFGYIKPGAPLELGYEVAAFKEKPDAMTAEAYVRDGYLWNSGMFLLDTDIFEEETRIHAPAVYEAFRKDTVAGKFAATPKISIDYGLLEKTDRLAVVPVSLDWKDIGTFAAFYDEYKGEADSDGNISLSEETFIDAKDCLVYSEGGKSTVLIGVQDIVVIDQPDALLVCRRGQVQQVKDAVDKLREKKDARADLIGENFYPWGTEKRIFTSPEAYADRLEIFSGKSVDVTTPLNSSTHFSVLEGTALVDGKDLCRGDAVTVPGNHALSIRPKGNQRLVLFRTTIPHPAVPHKDAHAL